MDKATKQHIITASAFMIAFAGYYIFRDRYSKINASSESMSSEGSSSKEVPLEFTVEGEVESAGDVYPSVNYTSNGDGTFTRQMEVKFPCTEVPCRMGVTQTKKISEAEYISAWQNK